MQKVRNISKKPVVVPLPQGKKLHLGPNQTGEISDHADDHPPLVKLVENGEIEIVGHDDKKPAQGKGTSARVREAPPGHQADVAKSHSSGER